MTRLRKSHILKTYLILYTTNLQYRLRSSESECEERTIKCHKAVLGARSAVFRAMFQHDMRENKHNEIIIQVMFSCHQVSTTM